MIQIASEPAETPAAAAPHEAAGVVWFHLSVMQHSSGPVSSQPAPVEKVHRCYEAQAAA